MWGVILFNKPDTMKIKMKKVRIAFWVILGLGIALTSLALNRPAASFQDTTATPTLQSETIVATAEIVEDAGSTDGIMLMAVIIVLIVIVPILLRRQAWSNGKRKKKLQGDQS
jgi:hypothetical protein